MSTLLFVAVLSVFIGAYIFYGKVVSRLFGIDPQRQTPAHSRFDGVDYVPAKNWVVLFGHHFASIAGAGPILGPVLGYLYWGWCGVLIWIVIGSIFMGAVHDFASLFISVREEGKTIGQIAEKYLSTRASKIFLLFLWCALILVIAVFAAICAQSFINTPEVVVSSLGLIPVAVIVGFCIYRLRINLIAATVFGLVVLSLLVVAGNVFPVVLSGPNPYLIWTIGLLLYAFIASVTPVTVLLQPRDYLASFLLLFGILVAVVGIFTRPFPITGAKLFVFNSHQAGPMMPIMFITVACGAVSGFHSLVSSGTTSKQIADERDIKKVGYGAMIVEGILASIVLFSVAFALKNIPEGETDAAAIFSLGFAKVGYFLGDYARFIALVILNAFILTTLDTATRITRFITQELFVIKNKWAATALVVAAAGYLACMQKWQVLWPIFGAANQLVAALALIVASSWLLCKAKRYRITLVPAVVMFIITFLALFVQMYSFIRQGNYLLSAIGFVLVVLGVFAIAEFRKVARCRV